MINDEVRGSDHDNESFETVCSVCCKSQWSSDRRDKAIVSRLGPLSDLTSTSQW